MLTLHIIAALTSLIASAWILHSPKKTGIILAGLLSVFTLASGILLAVNSPASLPRLCLAGSLLLFFNGYCLNLAYNRMRKCTPL